MLLVQLLRELLLRPLLKWWLLLGIQPCLLQWYPEAPGTAREPPGAGPSLQAGERRILLLQILRRLPQRRFGGRGRPRARLLLNRVELLLLQQRQGQEAGVKALLWGAGTPRRTAAAPPAADACLPPLPAAQSCSHPTRTRPACQGRGRAVTSWLQLPPAHARACTPANASCPPATHPWRLVARTPPLARA